MRVQEAELVFPAAPRNRNYLDSIRSALRQQLRPSEVPVRLAVTDSVRRPRKMEVAVLQGSLPSVCPGHELLNFRPRTGETADQFNVALAVPTGIDASIGGHAGDAAPVARSLAGLCDHLITHPNVVNASDINEMTPNTLYVEGSVLDRVLMGTAGLRKVRANRILAVVGAHEEDFVVHSTINAISAARSTLGITCRVVAMDEPFVMEAERSETGRAIGRIHNLEALCAVLDRSRNDYDAVAIASPIDLPLEEIWEYFSAGGDIGNPWGGVEAMLTHTVSALYEVPSAHAPMLESKEVLNHDPGLVDPRMAAEAISMTFLNCVFKGLHSSPAIVTEESELRLSSAISAEDISCLVIPSGCLGLATIAALEQGIQVIAVKENKNLMRNNLADLPWREGQYHEAENYWEAAGILAAMKAGVKPETMRRPFPATEIEVQGADTGQRHRHAG